MKLNPSNNESKSMGKTLNHITQNYHQYPTIKFEAENPLIADPTVSANIFNDTISHATDEQNPPTATNPLALAIL